MSTDTLIYKMILREEGEEAASDFMQSQIDGYKSLVRVFGSIAAVLLIGAYLAIKEWGSFEGLVFFLFWGGVSLYACFSQAHNIKTEYLVLTSAKYELEHDSKRL